MIYCQIENGVVTNRAVFGGEMPAGWALSGSTWVASDTANIGWGYVNGSFVAPAPAQPAPIVPREVSPYQARIALLNAGYLSSVEAMMADPATDAAAKIAWEYATVWQRDSAFIAMLAPALELTDDQVDDLFVAASQVT